MFSVEQAVEGRLDDCGSVAHCLVGWLGHDDADEGLIVQHHDEGRRNNRVSVKRGE